MNANDNACPDNRSANLGKRGNRGVPGAKGTPGIQGDSGTQGVQGSSGNFRIDVQFRGNEGEAYHYLPKSNKYNDISYIIFPGTTAWGGDIQKIKLAASLDFRKVDLGESITLEIDIIDVTAPINPIKILSSPLKHVETITNTDRKNLEKVQIISNGDNQNVWTTLTNLPTTEAMFLIKAKLTSDKKGPLVLGRGAKLYSLDLY